MTDLSELKRLAEACAIERCADESEHERNLQEFYCKADPEVVADMISDLQRLNEARTTDASRIMDMTRDIVAIGEALGIPGEEQAGGVDEFIDAIEQLKQPAPDFALRSRAADLLHLLHGAKIDTPSAGDFSQLVIAINDLDRLLSTSSQPTQQSKAIIDVLGAHRANRQEWLDVYEDCGPDSCIIDSAALLLIEVSGIIPVPPDLDFSAWLSQEELSAGNREKLVSACDLILAEIEFMDATDHVDTDTAAPAHPDQYEAWVTQIMHEAWIDKVMEQVVVFASAWSLIGGQFDTGNGLEHAEEEKQRLREMLEAGQ